MRSYCLLLLILGTNISYSQIRKINAESAVQNVTVFTSGAQINRVSNVSVLSGRTEIIFAGLSNQLEQQSLQLKADANITLLSVQTTKDYFNQRKIEQDEEELLNKQSKITQQVELDTKLLDVFKNEETMLVKNQEIGGQDGVKPIELKESLDLQRQRLTDVYQKQLELQKKITGQRKEISKIQLQLTEISKKKDSSNFSVTVLIDSKETRNIKFQLSYTVKDAGWYPVYDLRLVDVSQPLNALMNANVFQRSGESWKDVDLTLSTGNPNDNATATELQPWRLGFYDPTTAWMRARQMLPGETSGRIMTESGEPLPGASVTVKGTSIGTITNANGFFKLQKFPRGSVLLISSVGFSSKEVAAKPGYLTVKLSPTVNRLDEVVVTAYGISGRVAGIDISSNYQNKREEIQTVVVSTQYQPTAVVYKIEEKYSIETDGKTTTIGIKNFSVPALYDYYSAPKVDASAFLTAKILDWQNYDLQPGEVNLYFEGTFVGKTYLELDDANDTLAIALGKDNNVRISRKLIKEYSTKRLIGSNQTESRQYEISVRNLKKVPINIRVVDQVPVAITKDIDVLDVEAKSAELNKETGIVTWLVALKPGEEQKLQLKYAVKYPKERKVVID